MREWGPLIADLAANELLDELPVLIKDAKTMAKKDGSLYGSYTLADRSGSIGAVCWEQAPGADESGAVALVSGRVGEFRGAPQVVIQRLRLVARPAADLLDRLRAPLDRDRQRALLADLRAAEERLNPLFWAIFAAALGHDPYDVEAPFWTYAAGQSKHHTGPGELAWHVLTMLAHAERLAPEYPGLDLDLLRLAVLCHDLGKLDTYAMDLAGARVCSNERSVGHTFYSMARVSAALAQLRAAGATIDPADEEHLLHCLASHHGRRDWQALIEPETAEACALHALDLIDSRLRTTDTRDAARPPRTLAGGRGPAREPEGRAPRSRPEPPADQRTLFEE